jgi:hypothetical protein
MLLTRALCRHRMAPGFPEYFIMVLRKIAAWASRTGFGRSSMEEKADLSPFRERPTPRIIIGIFLMALSYVIGWPAVALFGVLAVYFGQPLIAIVGGPVIYGISHLVFYIGLYLAGVRYSRVFLRWATRRFIEKYA